MSAASAPPRKGLAIGSRALSAWQPGASLAKALVRRVGARLTAQPFEVAYWNGMRAGMLERVGRRNMAVFARCDDHPGEGRVDSAAAPARP